MFMSIVCPTCGQACRVPESSLGKRAVCPTCSQTFQCGTVSPRSLTAHPLPSEDASSIQEVPQVRATPRQTEATIHFRCARCQKPLESSADLAGQKINCPDCGQRLQIPSASSPPPVNKIVPAIQETPHASSVPVAPTVSQPRLQNEPILTVLPASPPAAPARREYCLECGIEVTERPRVQTCPDCGSLFCSARCYRDHCHHAHPRHRR